MAQREIPQWAIYLLAAAVSVLMYASMRALTRLSGSILSRLPERLGVARRLLMIVLAVAGGLAVAIVAMTILLVAIYAIWG